MLRGETVLGRFGHYEMTMVTFNAHVKRRKLIDNSLDPAGGPG